LLGLERHLYSTGIWRSITLSGTCRPLFLQPGMVLLRNGQAVNGGVTAANVQR
jgi:hypothetical protein